MLNAEYLVDADYHTSILRSLVTANHAKEFSVPLRVQRLPERYYRRAYFYKVAFIAALTPSCFLPFCSSFLSVPGVRLTSKAFLRGTSSGSLYRIETPSDSDYEEREDLLRYIILSIHSVKADLKCLLTCSTE